jgi:hypothetical protein
MVVFLHGRSFVLCCSCVCVCVGGGGVVVLCAVSEILLQGHYKLLQSSSHLYNWYAQYIS